MPVRYLPSPEDYNLRKYIHGYAWRMRKCDVMVLAASATEVIDMQIRRESIQCTDGGLVG